MRGIDKSACRAYLEPLVAPDLNSGLFLLDNLKYIIRTTVKNVGHRRMLVLYFYSREISSDKKPMLVFTIFQTSNAFITYDHRTESKTTWRTATLHNLDRTYYFNKAEFAFYSRQDETRTIKFCARYVPSPCQGNGIHTLNILQEKIRNAESRLRQRARELKIKQRMRDIRPFPKDMETWITHNVVPAYFFYDYQKGKVVKKGICSACSHEIELTGVQHNAQGVCPHCGRLLTMKSNGKRGTLRDRATASLIQKYGEHELLIRIVKAHSIWRKGETQELTWYEAIRIIIGRKADGEIVTEVYHDSFESAGITSWKSGYPPVLHLYGYNFNAETCGAVYERNLSKVLAGTAWQYCQLKEFYIGCHREDMEILPYLKAYLKHPRLEHLVKVGFLHLVTDMVYKNYHFCQLDEDQNRTHQILHVQAEDVQFLQELDIGAEPLQIFQKYCKMKLQGRQELLRWQLQRQVKYNIQEILQYTTPHKMIRFLEYQFPLLIGETTTLPARTRYSSMQDLVREYWDYLAMCKKERYNMKNNFVLFPKNLQEAHDKVAQRIKQKADAKMRRDFKAAYRRIMAQLDFEMEGMKIVYPKTPDEIVAEGHALHHCVGSYVERVARQECIILFLRKCEDVAKPFYTIEIQHKKVVQVRGMLNESATPEVEQFISRWQKDVLERPAVLQAA